MAIATINPATGEVVKTFEPLTAAQIEQKLQLAASAFRTTGRLHLRTARQDDARRRDSGKRKRRMCPPDDARNGQASEGCSGEALKCATGCRYYAENAEKFLADEVVETGAKRSFIRYLPIGPILAIMPWNFPFWQVFRFAAPALMAGNVGLLKHASNVPKCALKIEDILRRAGFPKVFSRHC
jgi:succinate-semialdehyde dehydrogenase / glutarate-semialdehyde dehydrogenase